MTRLSRLGNMALGIITGAVVLNILPLLVLPLLLAELAVRNKWMMAGTMLITSQYLVLIPSLHGSIVNTSSTTGSLIVNDNISNLMAMAASESLVLLNKFLSFQNSQFAGGILWGSNVPSSIANLLQSNGINYLLSVSSTKFYLLQGYLASLTGFLNRQVVGCGSILIFSLYYLVLPDKTVSSLRALIMCTVFVLASMVGRKLAFQNALLITVGVICLIDLTVVMDSAFQLILICVLSLHYLLPFLLKVLHIRYTFVRRYLIPPLAIWLGISPFLYIKYAQLSPVSLLASIVVFPFLTLVFGLLLSGCLVAAISPTIAGLLFAPLNWILDGFIKLQMGIHTLDLRLHIPSLVSVFIYIAILLILAYKWHTISKFRN